MAKRREVVRELSGGRCGYLHIPDMGGSGWAQFNRDLRMEVSRPALIVDVRGNAGGHISELVVEKLTRTILGWDLTRNAQPVSYASNAPRGPVVALADEATSSDGDMITAAFKLLGLGPVVGQRTWGGVVGMTGRHRLGDGTVITVPMNAAWFDAYGWSVENHGVAPDLEVLRTPLDWAEGRHAQLDDAVRLALDLLETHPAATPPDYTNVPDRAARSCRRVPELAPAKGSGRTPQGRGDRATSHATSPHPTTTAHPRSTNERRAPSQSEGAPRSARPKPAGGYTSCRNRSLVPHQPLGPSSALRATLRLPCARCACRSRCGCCCPCSRCGSTLRLPVLAPALVTLRPGAARSALRPAFCLACCSSRSALSWNWSFMPMWIHSRSG